MKFCSRKCNTLSVKTSQCHVKHEKALKDQLDTATICRYHYIINNKITEQSSKGKGETHKSTNR